MSCRILFLCAAVGAGLAVLGCRPSSDQTATPQGVAPSGTPVVPGTPVATAPASPTAITRPVTPPATQTVVAPPATPTSNPFVPPTPIVVGPGHTPVPAASGGAAELASFMDEKLNDKRGFARGRALGQFQESLDQRVSEVLTPEQLTAYQAAIGGGGEPGKKKKRQNPEEAVRLRITTLCGTNLGLSEEQFGRLLSLARELTSAPPGKGQHEKKQKNGGGNDRPDRKKKNGGGGETPPPAGDWGEQNPVNNP